MAKTPKRPVAVLQVKKLLQINAFIGKVRSVIKMMSDNASIFVNPSPPLADVTTHLNELTDAGAMALTRKSGSVAARDVKYKVVHEWEMGMNLNSFTFLCSTLKAKTQVRGLKPLTTVYFRHRVITNDGPLDWDYPVSLVIL